MAYPRPITIGSSIDSYEALATDFHNAGVAVHELGLHTAGLLVSSVTDYGVLRWLAVIAAIYLLIIDRTNWRTNFLTALLVPYIVLNLPPILFNLLRGEVGKWIAFVAVVIRLFFPNFVREKLELPAAIVILLVTLPNLVAVGFRNSELAILVSLAIGGYLLHQHIQHAGGFRNAFAAQKGIRVTVGILLLFVSPLWEFMRVTILFFF